MAREVRIGMGARGLLGCALVSAVALGCGDDNMTETESATVTASNTTPTASTTATATATVSGTNTDSDSETTPSGSDSETSATSTSATDTDPSTAGPSSSSEGTNNTNNSSSGTDPSSSTTMGVEPFCGDGNVDPDEECDDGDMIDNNMCSNSCTLVPCEDQGGNNMAVLSYIWIANSSQGTVSKINTETAIEEGRYYVEGGNPSRTSVNLEGDVAVSSRHPGGVTKIIAKEENCIDKNNDGMIQTSTGPNDILPLGTDECVAWQKPIGSPSYTYGPRATAWVAGQPDPITCQYPEPVLWMAWKDQQNVAHFLKIDSETGDTIDEVQHQWGNSFSPYGGAVDADGNFYATGLNQMPSVKIDFQTMEVTDLGNPNGCKYGMTLDLNGNIWAGACFGEGVYWWDHETNVWTTLPNSGGTRVNGIMADADGNVWGAGSSQCRLVHIDADTKQYVDNNIPLPGCSSPWGVSIDHEGYVWVVDMANKAFKVDPDTYEVVAEVTGLVGPYTYSDMTGVALQSQVVPQ